MTNESSAPRPDLFSAPVGALLRLTAERTPEAGGGPMAALSCAAAAALITMCARFAPDELGAPIVAASEGMPAELAVLADRDGGNFAALMAASRLPADHPGRDQVLRQAIERACEVPLQVCRLGRQLADDAALLAERGNPNLEGDALTALHLASAAVESAAQLIRLNAAQNAEAPAWAEADELRAQTRAVMRRLAPERR